MLRVSRDSAAADDRPPNAKASGGRRSAVRHILVYGLVGALLTTVLQLVEYRWLIIGHSFEIYAAMVAVLFAGVGIWAGRALARTTPAMPASASPASASPASASPPSVPAAPSSLPASAPETPFHRNPSQVAALGLTPRELDILEAIAAGLSNREIGAQLHVSENTVKTHSSRVFDKLGVQRRVQAVQAARRLGLIP